MAIDGFMLDVLDTPDNVIEFGRLDNGPKASAFPRFAWSLWKNVTPMPACRIGELAWTCCSLRSYGGSR